MGRDTPVRITERSAEFTTPNHDEVMLIYPFEAIAGHQDNGKKQLAFYDSLRYAKKQAEHGPAIYPTPTPFTLSAKK